MKPFTADDESFMRQALALAAAGEGRVSPNPPVGCVLVKNGAVVGRGWHDRLGDLHAEAMALRDAGEAARDADAYVTLSPCTTHGRQPPCSDALIRAGVAGVLVAADDPNPRNGSGVDLLNRAGVPARSGLLRDEAEYLARGFFKMMRRHTPFVTLKYAMTLDGKIAAASGDSRWVSGPESREMVHDLRSRHDAVVVGSGTALADDPLLNVRDPALSRRGGPDLHPQPARVVVDSRCRLPASAAMLRSDSGPGGPVLVATALERATDASKRLEAAGAEVLHLPGPDGRVDLKTLLNELGKRGKYMIFCEGGGGLAAGLLRAKLADELFAFIAPKLIGGNKAPGPVADLGLNLMADALPLKVRECIRVGNDICVRAGIV